MGEMPICACTVEVAASSTSGMIDAWTYFMGFIRLYEPEALAGEGILKPRTTVERRCVATHKLVREVRPGVRAANASAARGSIDRERVGGAHNSANLVVRNDLIVGRVPGRSISHDEVPRELHVHAE